jgi:hypothetical protein
MQSPPYKKMLRARNRFEEKVVKGEGVWAGKASEESTLAKAAEVTVIIIEPATAPTPFPASLS